jgi:hypothetical protein
MPKSIRKLLPIAVDRLELRLTIWGVDRMSKIIFKLRQLNFSRIQTVSIFQYSKDPLWWAEKFLDDYMQFANFEI